MNVVLHGTAVSAGITIGHAHLVSSARLEAAHYEIPDSAVAAEIFRFDAVQRRNLTAKHVELAAKGAGLLDAQDVHRMFDDANQRTVASRVVADGAGRLFG